MDLPASLPAELAFLSVTSEEEFLDILLSCSFAQQLHFLEAAVQDETWCERHAEVMQKWFQHATDAFLERKLSTSDLLRIARALRAHSSVLRQMLPRDLAIEVRGQVFSANTLLFGALGRPIREMIQVRATTYEPHHLNLGLITPRVFRVVEEFAVTGKWERLATETKEELLEDLIASVELEIAELHLPISTWLAKYLTMEELELWLPLIHRYQLTEMRRVLCEKGNTYFKGIRLESAAPQELALIIDRFEERDSQKMEQLAPFVTRLGFRGTAAEDPRSLKILRQCRALKCLDLSETLAYPAPLMDEVRPIQDMRLRACNWVDNETLAQLLALHPNLRRLDLSANPQLTESLFYLLSDGQSLEALSLAYCHQFKDREIDLLLSLVGSGLTELDLSWCSALTDRVIPYLVRAAPRLLTLQLAHCPLIGDAGLRGLTKSPQLRTLNLRGCMGISDEGAVDMALQAPHLAFLDLSFCPLSQSVSTRIKAKRPSLKLVMD